MGDWRDYGSRQRMTERAETPGIRLTVRNFRGVRDASWAPEGVCALVGPNATGKSTLLEAFLFLRNAALRSPKDALTIAGGMQAFMHHAPLLDHPGDAPALARVRFTAETPDARWTISFSATNDNVAATYDEELVATGQATNITETDTTELHNASMLAAPVWRRLSKRDAEGQVAVLRERIENLVLYRPWELQRFRKQPWSDPALDDTQLAVDGANLFVVLQNWRDSRLEGWRYEWVIKHMQVIHARSFSGLELKKGGGVLSAQFYAPGDETPLPIKSASDGVLGTLLTLAAAASARGGGVVLLDEPDNGLHPFAIRSLVSAFRSLYEERGVNVVLATHSPVILNAFSETPEDVWVTERKEGATFPTRLTELCDPEWLANFRLGNLYGTGFGRQDPLSGSDAERHE